jgi:hypothetical protein
MARFGFRLGDLIADEIVIREVFRIPEGIDIEQAVIEILDRLRTARCRVHGLRRIFRSLLAALSSCWPLASRTMKQGLGLLDGPGRRENRF